MKKSAISDTDFVSTVAIATSMFAALAIIITTDNSFAIKVVLSAAACSCISIAGVMYIRKIRIRHQFKKKFGFDPGSVPKSCLAESKVENKLLIFIMEIKKARDKQRSAYDIDGRFPFLVKKRSDKELCEREKKFRKAYRLAILFDFPVGRVMDYAKLNGIEI